MKKIISGATGISTDLVSMIVEAVKKKEAAPIKIEAAAESPISRKYIAIGALVISVFLLVGCFFWERKRKRARSKAIRPVESSAPAANQQDNLSQETSWGAF